MKKIVITISILFLFSCNSNERELKNEIIKLRAENKKLTAAINYSEIKKIVSLQIALDPESVVTNVNQNNKIKGRFIRFDKMPEYDLYITNERTKERKKLFGNIKDPNFEFTYMPTSKNDTLIQISAVMEIGNKIVELPRKLNLVVK